MWNNLLAYRYSSSNPRSNAAICASCSEQDQIGLYNTPDLKSHLILPTELPLHGAAVCLPQKWKCYQISATWKAWLLGEQADRTLSHRERFRDKIAKRDLRHIFRLVLWERSDTDQIILCILCIHHMPFHQNLLRQGMTMSESKAWPLIKIRHDN